MKKLTIKMLSLAIYLFPNISSSMKSSTVNGTSGEESIKRRNIIKYPTKKEMDRKHKIEMENIRRDSLAKENRKKMINEGISAKIKAEAEKASNDSKIPE